MARTNDLFRKLAALAAILVALAASAPAWAQTTGSLKGTIVDDTDIGIPAVKVILEGENLIGGAQARDTDGNGNYNFSELPPGTYSLTAQKEGFRGVTVAGVLVNVNRATIRNITLELSEAEETIVVEDKAPVVDVEDVTRGEVLSKEFLQRIPAGRSYQSAVQMVAGVVGGSNPNIGGGAYNENTYMLDGVNITDPVTGTFSLNFNYDAIQQIEVQLGGYMPEYGVSLGGIINLVTESGTNNLEFDTSAYYTNGNWRNRMDARYTHDGFDLAPTDFDSTFEIVQISGKIAGPIVRDRAWFIISYQHDRSIIANVGIDQPRDYDGHYILAKLTVQPNAEHRLTTFLQLDPTAIDNTDQGNQFQKPEAQGRQYQGGFAAQARWQWFMSPDVNLDTQLVVQKSFIEVGAVPCTHDRQLGYHPCQPGEAEGDVDWQTPGRVGVYGAYSSVNYGIFYFDDRIRYNASSKLSLLSLEDPMGGSHDVKVGVEGAQLVWDQIQGYSGSTLYYDANFVAYDPTTFQNFSWFEITGPIKFRTSGSQWNFFVQDSWKPVSNLVVKGGVRFDNTVMRNDLGEPVVTGAMWGPRLYASWDPFGDQKSKVAGGYGRFNDTSRLAVADFTSAGNYGSKYFVGEYFESYGLGYINTQDMVIDVDDKTIRNQAHDNLKLPRADEVSIILQREVIEDVGIETNIAYKMTRHMYEADQLNLIFDQDGSTSIGNRYADSLLSLYRLRTPELAKRDYLQWDWSLYKVNSRRWFGSLTYTYTQSIGSSSQALSGAFTNDPQTQYNYGPFVQTDLRHVVKGYASWQLPTDPWKQTIGATFQYYSGPPLERLYDLDGGSRLRIRERGIYTRFPPYWTSGVKFTQDIDVRKGVLQLDFQALNVFNNRAPDNFSAAFYSENRLLIYSRQDPLRLQLGARYEF